VSPELQELIQKLCCEKESRMCQLKDISSHPFFRGLDWMKMANSESPAPFIPQSTDVTMERATKDAAPFVFKRSDSASSLEESSLSNALEARKSVAFVGFTYKKFQPFQFQSQRNPSMVPKDS
jgi:hypothetical protein